LEEKALLASGVKDRLRIAEYTEKLDHLQHKILSRLGGEQNPMVKAKIVFDWLWLEKPFRYVLSGSYKLNEVIDAQVSELKRTVGNCLGLTVLYNCLLQRLGIRAGAVYLESAFNKGPHVLTSLTLYERMIDIENILPDGFDYKGHFTNQSRVPWGNRELVSDIYHSQGNDFFNEDHCAEALQSYDMAINLNPAYEKAYLNKAILLDKLKEKTIKVKS